MNRKILLALLTAVFVLLAAGCALAEEEEETVYVENIWNFVDGSMDVSQGIPDSAEGLLLRIKEKGRLRVATEPYFPPQEFIDPSQSGQARYVGADMELARLIAKRMGVELEIVPMDFTRVLDAVVEGECDLAISALSFTPARASRVTFSKGYYFTDAPSNGGVLIRSGDRDEITQIEDLKNKTIIAQSGSLQEALGTDNILYYREFRRVPSLQEVYGAVQEGDADAAIVDVETAQLYIESHPRCGLTLTENIRFTLEPQFNGDRIAGPKGELALMYFINGVIDEAMNAGLYSQWFDEAAELARRLEQE